MSLNERVQLHWCNEEKECIKKTNNSTIYCMQQYCSNLTRRKSVTSLVYANPIPVVAGPNNTSASSPVSANYGFNLLQKTEQQKKKQSNNNKNTHTQTHKNSNAISARLFKVFTLFNRLGTT